MQSVFKYPEIGASAFMENYPSFLCFPYLHNKHLPGMNTNRVLQEHQHPKIFTNISIPSHLKITLS